MRLASHTLEATRHETEQVRKRTAGERAKRLADCTCKGWDRQPQELRILCRLHPKERTSAMRSERPQQQLTDAAASPLASALPLLGSTAGATAAPAQPITWTTSDLDLLVLLQLLRARWPPTEKHVVVRGNRGRGAGVRRLGLRLHVQQRIVKRRRLVHRHLSSKEQRE
jgi:hypothetical protein